MKTHNQKLVESSLLLQHFELQVHYLNHPALNAFIPSRPPKFQLKGDDPDSSVAVFSAPGKLNVEHPDQTKEQIDCTLHGEISLTGLHLRPNTYIPPLLFGGTYEPGATLQSEQNGGRILNYRFEKEENS